MSKTHLSFLFQFCAIPLCWCWLWDCKAPILNYFWLNCAQFFLTNLFLLWKIWKGLIVKTFNMMSGLHHQNWCFTPCSTWLMCWVGLRDSFTWHQYSILYHPSLTHSVPPNPGVRTQNSLIISSLVSIDWLDIS